MNREDIIQYLITLKMQQHYCDKKGTFIEDIGPDSFVFVINSAIEALRKETQWIPVNERLPEEEYDVLVCNKNGDIEIARGSYSTEIKNEFIWYTSSWRFGKVTAWMPLPYIQPKTEVRETGHWVEDIVNGKALYSCSECLHTVSNYEGCFHYCPYCGRELKGVIRNER